ncbi:MAG: molecular chaperone HtpG [Bacteroidetes bacterium]|nr:molecular chaperone HtpG [Bacteroidota bacterium]
MPSNPTTMEFKSELKQILNLITHSLYSHKEVFLRELISNASDAIDKVRFDSLNNESLLEGNKDWKIKIIADKAKNTLTITDNGIGMSRDTIIDNLGTIAKSGTKEFLEQLKQAEAAAKPELIGQFGVGFYSAFMVADSVTVISRTAGDPSQGVRWVSDGQGAFTVEPAEKAERGTEIILALKAEEKEFTEPWKIRSLVKQFSDFIEHPVVMDVEKEDEQKVKTVTEEVLNSRKVLWLRSKSDVTKEEYDQFYQSVSNDFTPPARTIHYTGEGVVEFKVLLFIPSKKPFDMMFGETKVGPRLYIRRVLIMDHCEQLLPPYLRFVKGVVDCADLPLNVSREMLQQNPMLEKIKTNLVKSVLKNLEEMMKSSYDEYVSFFKEFGTFLKEGLNSDWGNRDQLTRLLLFGSLRTDEKKFISLQQYVDAMGSEQKEIYYLTGEDRETLVHTPYLELFRSKQWDVLFMTDPIDEFILPYLPEFAGKKLVAADKNEITPEDAAVNKEQQEAFSGLFGAMKPVLEHVKEIRVSARLKESAACLVSDKDGMSSNMERIMQKLGRMDEERTAERILELNVEHPAVQSLKAIYDARKDDPRIGIYTQLLYDQAVIAEGSKVKDPVAFAQRINQLMVERSGN